MTETLSTIRLQLSADCEPRPYGVLALRLRNLLPIKQALLDGSRPWIKEHALSTSSTSTTSTFDDASYALARSNAFNLLLSDSLTQSDFGFGTESVFSLLTDTSPPLVLDRGGSSSGGNSRVIAAPFQLLNHFPNSPALTSKAGLIRSLNRHYAGSAAHVFDVIPMTYCISIGGRSGTMFAEQESPTMAQFVKRFLSLSHATNRIGGGNGNETSGGASVNVGTVGLVTGMHLPQKHCSRNLWIIKPAVSGSSMSSLIIDRIDDVSAYALNAKQDFVIQKLIEQPLLVKGRKATVRLWALLTDSGDIYVYRAPLVLLSNKPYSHIAMNAVDIHSAADARSVHVVSESLGSTSLDSSTTTSSSSSSSSSNSSSTSCETISWAELGDYISKEPVMSTAFPHGVLDTIIFPRMKRIISEAIRGAMAAPIVPGPLDIGGGVETDTSTALLPTSAPMSFAAASPRSGFRSRRCFELFGVDFVLDEDLRPWLVSFSENPTLSLHTPRHLATVQRMAQELVRIAVDPLFPAPVPSNTGDDDEEEEVAQETSTSSSVSISKQRPLQRSLQFTSSFNKSATGIVTKPSTGIDGTLTDAEQYLPTPGFSTSAYIERSVITPTGPKALYTTRVSQIKNSSSSLNRTNSIVSPPLFNFDSLDTSLQMSSSGVLMKSQGERGFEIIPGINSSTITTSGQQGQGQGQQADFCFELVYRAHLAEDVETLSYSSMVTAALSPTRGGGGVIRSGPNRSSTLSPRTSLLMQTTTPSSSSSLALAVQTQIKEALSLTLPPRTRPLHLVPLWAFLGPEPTKNKLSWMQDQDLRGATNIKSTLSSSSSSSSYNITNNNYIQTGDAGGEGGSGNGSGTINKTKLSQAYIHAPLLAPPSEKAMNQTINFQNTDLSKKSIVAAAAQAAAAAASSSNPREALSRIAETLRSSGLNHADLSIHAPFLAALLEGGGQVLPPPTPTPLLLSAPPPPPSSLQVSFALSKTRESQTESSSSSSKDSIFFNNEQTPRRAWNAGTPVSGQGQKTSNTVTAAQPVRDWSKVAPRTHTGQRIISSQPPKPPTVQQQQSAAQNAMTTQSALQRRQRLAQQQRRTPQNIKSSSSAVLATSDATLAPHVSSIPNGNTPNYLKSTDASNIRSITISEVLASHHSQQQSLQVHLNTLSNSSQQPLQQQQQQQQQQHVFTRPELSPLKKKELEAEALAAEKKRLESTLIALQEKKKQADDASKSPNQQRFSPQQQYQVLNHPISPTRPTSSSSLPTFSSFSSSSSTTRSSPLPPPAAPSVVVQRIPSSSIYAPYAGNIWVGESSTTSLSSYSLTRPSTEVYRNLSVGDTANAAPSYEDMLYDHSVPRRAPALVAAAANAAAAAKAASDAAKAKELVERESMRSHAASHYAQSHTDNMAFNFERPTHAISSSNTSSLSSSYSIRQQQQPTSEKQLLTSSTSQASKQLAGGLSIAAMAAAALSARANGS